MLLLNFVTIHEIKAWSGDLGSTTELWQTTQFHIEDRVQHYEDRYKADARRGGKGKTQQECCNMNDVYLSDTSEQIAPLGVTNF